MHLKIFHILNPRKKKKHAKNYSNPHLLGYYKIVACTFIPKQQQKQGEMIYKKALKHDKQLKK